LPPAPPRKQIFVPVQCFVRAGAQKFSPDFTAPVENSAFWLQTGVCRRAAAAKREHILSFSGGETLYFVGAACAAERNFPQIPQSFQHRRGKGGSVFPKQHSSGGQMHKMYRRFA